MLKIFGSKFLFNFLFKNRLVVFLFHEVSNNPSRFYKENNLNIIPSLFEKQIEYILNNFKAIHPKELFTKRSSSPHALITFDDGSIGVFENAFKILEKKKCPSILFINFAPFKNEIFWSGLIIYLCNNYNSFKKIINPNNEKYIIGKEFLYANDEHLENFFKSNDTTKIYESVKKYYGKFGSIDDLKNISESNYISIGNHLYNHYNAAQIDEKKLVDNYNKNKIPFINNDLDYFSYPFGQKNTCYNDKTNKILLRLGVKAIFTANPLSFDNKSMLFHRFPIDESFVSEEVLLAKLNYTRIRNILFRA